MTARRIQTWMFGFRGIVSLLIIGSSLMNVARCGDVAVADSAKPTSKPTSVKSGKTRDLTFDDLKFEMKTGDPFDRSLLTERIEELNGVPIRIRGYIRPCFQQTGIKQFVLVRDNLECCFGPGAALFDCIVVDMEPNKSATFTVRPVAVEGRFTISEFKGPDGKHLAIYHLSGQNVK